jgi:hypothetical protein
VDIIAGVTADALKGHGGLEQVDGQMLLQLFDWLAG